MSLEEQLVDLRTKLAAKEEQERTQTQKQLEELTILIKGMDKRQVEFGSAITVNQTAIQTVSANLTMLTEEVYGKRGLGGVVQRIAVLESHQKDNKRNLVDDHQDLLIGNPKKPGLLFRYEQLERQIAFLKKIILLLVMSVITFLSKLFLSWWITK